MRMYSLNKLYAVIGRAQLEKDLQVGVGDVVILLAEALVDDPYLEGVLETRCLFDFEERGEGVRVLPIVKCDKYLARAEISKMDGEEEAVVVPEELVTGNRWQQEYLRGCMVHDDDEKHPKVNRTIVKKLASVGSSSTALDFSGHLLGPFGAVPLVTALTRHPSLTTLDLSWNDLREPTLPPILTLLAETPTLTSLSLDNNRYLAATAGRILLSAVKKNTHLLRLSLKGCNIPPYHLKTIDGILGSRSPPSLEKSVRFDEAMPSEEWVD